MSPHNETLSLCGKRDGLAIKLSGKVTIFLGIAQRYKYRVLQTIQMKLILVCVWAERTVLGSATTSLKFNYEIEIG